MTIKDDSFKEYTKSLKSGLKNKVVKDYLYTCILIFTIYKIPKNTQRAFWYLLFNLTDCNDLFVTITPKVRNFINQIFKNSQNVLKQLLKANLLMTVNDTRLPTYHVKYKVLSFGTTEIEAIFRSLRRSLIEAQTDKLSDFYYNSCSIKNKVENQQQINQIINKEINTVVRHKLIGEQFSYFYRVQLEQSKSGNLKISSINLKHNNKCIKPKTLDPNCELVEIFNNVRLNKDQKSLLTKNFIQLKGLYINLGLKEFEQHYVKINGLGGKTKKILINHFEKSRT
jgi:hypothetical protein